MSKTCPTCPNRPQTGPATRPVSVPFLPVSVIAHEGFYHSAKIPSVKAYGNPMRQGKCANGTHGQRNPAETETGSIRPAGLYDRTKERNP